MTVPQLKPEFYTQAESSMGVMSPLLDIINRALELQYSEQETYITAEEARELGAGNAETFSSEFGWHIVGYQHQYSMLNQYRAIKQALEDAVALFDNQEWDTRYLADTVAQELKGLIK